MGRFEYCEGVSRGITTMEKVETLGKMATIATNGAHGWVCRRCSERFEHGAAVQYRVWTRAGAGGSVAVVAIEKFDPELDGTQTINARGVQEPTRTQGERELPNEMTVGPLWLCDNCFDRHGRRPG